MVGKGVDVNDWKVRLRLALERIRRAPAFADDDVHREDRFEAVEDVVSALRFAVQQHPDQRVGQVLSNAIEGSLASRAATDSVLFYIDNVEIERALYDYGEGVDR
jgi:hypothetical protein